MMHCKQAKTERRTLRQLLASRDAEIERMKSASGSRNFRDGEWRRMQSERDEAVRACGEAQHLEKIAMQRRNRADAVVVKLAEERQKLTLENTALTRDLKEVAAAAAKDAVEAAARAKAARASMLAAQRLDDRRHRKELDEAWVQVDQASGVLLATGDEICAAEKRAADAEKRVAETEAQLQEMVEALDLAHEDAMEAAAEAAAGLEARDAAEHAHMLAERREERAKKKAAALAARVEKLAPKGKHYSPDEWASLTRNARYQASFKARKYLLALFRDERFHMEDLGDVLAELRLLDQLMDSRAGFQVYYDRVDALMKQLERNDYGMEFGLFLRYEMHLTLPKILSVVQGACKKYSRVSNRYESKVVLHHRHLKGEGIAVPRLVPPRNQLQKAITAIEETIGVEPGQNGKLALRSIDVVVQEMLARAPGKHDMPPLSSFIGGAMKLPIIISFDGTGYGNLSINTIAARSPWAPQTASSNYIFGVGKCKDNKEGTSALLGPNLQTINQWIMNEKENLCCVVDVGGESVEVMPDVHVSLDAAALRHCEHIANSGWCGCSSDFALRCLPRKPATEGEMDELVGKNSPCVSHTREARYILGHNTIPGEDLPRPCTAAGCAFAHNRETAAQEQEEMLATEAELANDLTKTGVARFSRWRMAHAHAHANVQPGKYGEPMLQHDLDRQILEPLHLAELGIPKTAWKYGILENASDDARALISEKLHGWKHSLDTKRKEEGRDSRQKWFTGGAWWSFCAGHKGSPGGPKAIAEIVLIIAEDMQQRGVTLPHRGTSKAGESAAIVVTEGGRGGRGRGGHGGRGGGRSKQAFSARSVAPATLISPDDPTADNLLVAKIAELERVPTAMERAADPEDIALIRGLYGSRAQTLINMLLAFDAYFAWYYPLKASIPLYAEPSVKRSRALDNCRSAIDMAEIFERVSVRRHKSFLIHGAIYKVTRDILKVDDIWSFGTSALELQNAETKRVATASASRRQELSTSGMTIIPMRGTREGPAQLRMTKGYSTTFALSLLNHLLATAYLRQGEGVFSMPDSRRRERLLNGTGRLTLQSTGVKLEKLAAATPSSDESYEPTLDTCLKAFVRLIAALAEAQKASQ